LPDVIDNAYVVSAADLAGLSDNMHFLPESYRTFGARYAETTISALGLDQ
jgi:hypothetical protein